MAYAERERNAARETFCRLLSACYYEPGPELAEEQVFDAMTLAASRFDPELAVGAQRLAAAFDAEPHGDLLVDYARLFLGPPLPLAKPYGSVWLGDAQGLMLDSSMAVAELYRQGGFELDAEFRDLPDHIAAELEFLYLLLFRENQASDPAALAQAADLRRHVLHDHLAAWTGAFTATMAEAAETEFYRALAALTHRFVQEEARRVGPASASQHQRSHNVG